MIFNKNALTMQTEEIKYFRFYIKFPMYEYSYNKTDTYIKCQIL